MPEWPPWEWAEGDPTQCARATFVFGAVAGAAVVSLVLFSLILLGFVTLLGPPIPLGWWQVVTWAELAVALGIPILIPRRVAMVAALGISPAGMRLKLPLFYRSASHEFVPWSQVHRIGPDWVELYGFRGLGFLPERYRLTDKQSQRLGSFLGAPRLPIG